MNELSLLSGCSQKKAEAIIAQRPFKGWLDMVCILSIVSYFHQLFSYSSVTLPLERRASAPHGSHSPIQILKYDFKLLQVEKFNDNKLLSTELLNSTQELLTTRNNIQRLMKKCVGLAQQLEAAVAAGAGRLKQPSILDPR